MAYDNNLNRALIATVIVVIVAVSLPGQVTPATIPSLDIVCYVNTTRFNEGYQIQDLQKALPSCNHLILGYATIDEQTYRVQVDDALKIPLTFFKNIANLKQQYAQVKSVYLAVGGGNDRKIADKKKNKYLDLLESRDKVSRFVQSADQVLQTYGFDGLDLSWQFPEIPPPPEGFLKKVKSFFFKAPIIDKNEKEHRMQFVYLLEELTKQFSGKKSLALTVLPNVNSTAYYDVANVAKHVKQVHVLPFDCFTPARNPKDPWFTSPIKAAVADNDARTCNIQDAITYWSDSNKNNAKIFLGIPTYGRTWGMVAESKSKGYLDLVITGPGKAGPRTHEPGLLAYDEICTLVNNNKQYVKSENKNEGTYVQKIPNQDKEEGIQIGFDTIDYIRSKIEFAKNMKLGGLALFDLTLDDYSGKCDNQPHSLLNKIKNLL